MIQKELVKEIAASLVIPVSTVKAVLDQLGLAATYHLQNGAEVPLPGIGKLCVRHRKERVGRNPRENTEIVIPARNTVFLKVTKDLKSVVQ